MDGGGGGGCDEREDLTMYEDHLSTVSYLYLGGNDPACLPACTRGREGRQKVVCQWRPSVPLAALTSGGIVRHEWAWCVCACLQCSAVDEAGRHSEGGRGK